MRGLYLVSIISHGENVAVNAQKVYRVGRLNILEPDIKQYIQGLEIHKLQFCTAYYLFSRFTQERQCDDVSAKDVCRMQYAILNRTVGPETGPAVAMMSA